VIICNSHANFISFHVWQVKQTAEKWLWVKWLQLARRNRTTDPNNQLYQIFCHYLLKKWVLAANEAKNRTGKGGPADVFPIPMCGKEGKA
jgi:hypothetical protein